MTGVGFRRRYAPYVYTLVGFVVLSGVFLGSGTAALQLVGLYIPAALTLVLFALTIVQRLGTLTREKSRAQLAEFLENNGFARHYRHSLKLLLFALDKRWLGTTKAPSTRAYWAQPPSLRHFFHVKSFWFCLRLALTYPIIALLVGWVFSGQLYIMASAGIDTTGAPGFWIRLGWLVGLLAWPLLVSGIASLFIPHTKHSVQRVFVVYPAVAVAVAFAVAVAVVAFAFAFAFAFVFAGAGAVDVVFAGAGAGAVAFALAGAGAVVFAFALAGAFASTVAVAYLFSLILFAFVAWDSGLPLVAWQVMLPLLLMPLVNALFDFLSLAVSRFFLSKIAGQRRLWGILLELALDLVFALACLAGLFFALSAMLGFASPWVPADTANPFHVPTLIKTMQAEPLSAGLPVWIMLATTLLPSLLHALAAFVLLLFSANWGRATLASLLRKPVACMDDYGKSFPHLSEYALSLGLLMQSVVMLPPLIWGALVWS